VYRLVIEFIISIILIPFFCGAVSFRALLQSVVRRLLTADVTPPTGTLFSKVPDMKTVITSTVSHIGGIGGGFGIRRRGSTRSRWLAVRGRPLTC